MNVENQKAGTADSTLDRIKSAGKQKKKEKIVILGVGGAGCNIVKGLYESGLSVACNKKEEGVAELQLLVANTDIQSLESSPLDLKDRILLTSPNTEEGIGAGANPEVAREAAEHTMSTILERTKGAKIVFLVGGMGKGTGQGALKPIAHAIRSSDVLVVAIVTTPFEYEGPKRMSIAKQGIKDLKEEADTLIVIPNQSLVKYSNSDTPFWESIRYADEMLNTIVKGITELISNIGLINLDLADVCAVMKNKGYALVGYGKASGVERDRADAIDMALSHPLRYELLTIENAEAVLINIVGGAGLGILEVDTIAREVQKQVKNPEAQIIIGTAISDELQDTDVTVLVIATGLKEVMQEPNKNPGFSGPLKPISDKENTNISSDEPKKKSFMRKLWDGILGSEDEV